MTSASGSAFGFGTELEVRGRPYGPLPSSLGRARRRDFTGIAQKGLDMAALEEILRMNVVPALELAAVESNLQRFRQADTVDTIRTRSDELRSTTRAAMEDSNRDDTPGSQLPGRCG
jgi:hypothetical protein